MLGQPLTGKISAMPRLPAREHDLVTTFGRLVEVYGTLESRLGRSLEEACGVPHSWFEVLLRLARSPEERMTMGALAEQITLTTGGVTRLIDRMISAGYVERLPCPGDRRVSFAALTPAGRAKLAEARTVHAANLERVFAGFSREEVATLDALLDRLREDGSTRAGSAAAARASAVSPTTG